MEKLIEFVNKCGGFEKAAVVLGEKNYQTIQAWIRKNRVSSTKVVNVHRITQIPLAQLNPDLYGDHVIQAEIQPHSN